MATMKIKDVFEEPIFISPSTTKAELKKIAKRHPHTDLFIVADKKKKFLGTIHEDDLFLMFIPNELYEEIGGGFGMELERRFFAKNASEVMSKHDLSCTEDDSIIDIATLLAREEADAIPVLKEGKVIGVVNRGTLVRYL